MAYEFLDHTADLRFRASGGTLQEALVESAKALTEAIAGDSRIEPKVERKFTVTIHLAELLVHDFLQELIFLFSTEQLLFSEFDLTLREAMGYRLTVKARGEPYDEKRHKLVKEVKAVTYHDMKVRKEEGGWVIEVVCDT